LILQSDDLMELRFDPIDVMRFIDDDLLVHCANRQDEAYESGSVGSMSAMFSITLWGGNARELREEQIACRTGRGAVPPCLCEQRGPPQPLLRPSSNGGTPRPPLTRLRCSTEEPSLTSQYDDAGHRAEATEVVDKATLGVLDLAPAGPSAKLVRDLADHPQAGGADRVAARLEATAGVDR